jgi:hypothetical protein
MGSGQPGPVDHQRWTRLASPATATVLGVVAVILLALYVVTAGLVRQLSALNIGPLCLIILIYAGVGVVVARRQPRNPVGWILLVFVLLFMLGSASGYYAVYSYRLGHHGLPFAALAVLLEPAWIPALAVVPLAILLFPDGHLTSRRWRLVLWIYAALWTSGFAAIWLPTVIAVAGHHVRLDSFGDVEGSGGQSGNALSAVEVVVVAAIVLIWLSFVAHQVLSWRRATGERRQQQKWLASGALITLVGVILGSAFSGSGVGSVAGAGIAALPVGIGIGILKYRLYEIDRIISRTVAYALVTGLLVGVYAGLVLLATHVLEVSSPVAVAASTLVAAALFNPLRRQIQQLVDRRFNRARYDAERTVRAFAARLMDAVDLDAVRDDLADVVNQALEPTHVSVWSRPHD